MSHCALCLSRPFTYIALQSCTIRTSQLIDRFLDNLDQALRVVWNQKYPDTYIQRGVYIGGVYFLNERLQLERRKLGKITVYFITRRYTMFSIRFDTI